MESILSTELTVSLHQVMILLTIITIALLFGYLKVGLLFTYGFLFFWSNIFGIRALFDPSDPHLATASFLYLGFGLIIVFLAMVGFLLHKR